MTSKNPSPDVFVDRLESEAPPLRLTPDAVRQHARTLRRRRIRQRGAVLAAVVLVGAGSFAAFQIASSDSLRGGPTTDPAEATFDPDVFAAQFGDVAGQGEPVSPREGSVAVRAFDADGEVLHGYDRRRAKVWKGDFTLASGVEVDVNASYPDDLPDADAADLLAQQCSVELERRHYQTCVTGTTENGLPMLVSEKATRPAADGWLSLDPDTLGGGVHWYARTATVVWPGGQWSTVLTAVRSEGLGEARMQFPYSTQEIADIAADPRLVFPREPGSPPADQIHVPDDVQRVLAQEGIEVAAVTQDRVSRLSPPQEVLDLFSQEHDLASFENPPAVYTVEIVASHEASLPTGRLVRMVHIPNIEQDVNPPAGPRASDGATLEPTPPQVVTTDLFTFFDATTEQHLVTVYIGPAPTGDQEN